MFTFSGPLPSFKQYKKDKSNERTGMCYRVAKKKKNNDDSNQMVSINIGLMRLNEENQLKVVWGKRLPVKTRKCSTHAEILASSIEKWKKFDKNFDAGRQYQLLYPDTSHALFMPGGCKDFFELKAYKEELGKEYKNIVLFLCTVEEFDAVNYNIEKQCSEEEGNAAPSPPTACEQPTPDTSSVLP